MGIYETLRYDIVPPVFVVFFTSSVQLLALAGRGEAITLTAVFSGFFGNAFSWCFVSILVIWAFLWLIITKEEYYGTVSDYGYKPVYKAGGVLYYWVSLVSYLCCEFFNPGLSSTIYWNMPEILGSFNIVAFLLCIYLYFQPSVTPSEDANLPKIYLFYRGQDLHPRLFTVDIKQLVICRISIIGWQILIIAFLIASVHRNGFNFPAFTTCVFQTIYLCTFYYWEKGYFTTIDVIYDRAGYYICWGSLVWIPCFYTFTSYYFVFYVPVVNNYSTCLVAFVGLLCMAGNWWANFQKLKFRSSSEGRCTIWGKQATFIRAKYKDQKGQERISLLLTSGLWGVVRHLNYTLEIIHTFAWCYPGLGLGVYPFLYFIFIVILLLHRVFRDEEKCKMKYGHYWDEYCHKVPYRLLPNVF